MPLPRAYAPDRSSTRQLMPMSARKFREHSKFRRSGAAVSSFDGAAMTVVDGLAGVP